MKFRIINTYKNANDESYVKEINQKLEYFHHYWNFLLDDDKRWVFMKDERFESHRSLFTKINLQLSENSKKYPRRLSALFMSHPYFGPNILLRKSKATITKINAVKLYFNNNFVKIQDDKQSLHVNKLKTDLGEIEKLIVGKRNTIYITKILRVLVRSLQHKSRISAQWKEDVKFLINAIIIELYHFGYSLNYLKKIPDIILFPITNKDDFPFEKTFADFQYDKKTFELYKAEELLKLSFKKQIASLLNLVKRPKIKGHLIFKIDDFDFQDDALKILDVTFYNPQNDSQLNTRNLNLEYSQYVIGLEKYFEQFVKETDKAKFASNCNAIIKVQYRPLIWGKTDNSIYHAIKKVDNALQILKRQKYYYVGGNSRFSKICLGTYILTNDKYEYRQAPEFYDDNRFERPFTIDAARKKLMHENLGFINDLHNVSGFHSRILDIVVILDKYLVDRDSFTFKDFWIKICEPLFPNDHKGFIAFSKRCLRFYLNRKFQLGIKILLSDALKENNGYYSVPPNVFRDLGLNIEILKPISAKRFSREYSKVGNHLEFEFLMDILSEIDKYSQNPNDFFDETDKWLEKILYEVYAERNLEVHNNITTNLSLIKLRDDCLEIANITLLAITEKLRKTTRYLEDLKI